MPCKHATHAPATALSHIHDVIHGDAEAEFGAGRQKCAALAYENGYAIGQNSAHLPGGEEECPKTLRRAPREMLESLPRCQAAEGRHTCCICAYHEGFNAARAIAIGQQIGNDVAATVSDALKKSG